MEVIKILLILMVIIFLGISMLTVVRWARKKNIELETKGVSSQQQVVEETLNGGNIKSGVINYLTSTISKSESSLGKVLAVLVILFVSAFLLFITYAAIKNI